MKHSLSEKFNNLTPEETERVYASLEPDAVMDPETEKRIEARLNRKLPSEKPAVLRTLSKVWKPVIVAAAACLVVYLTLGFTVPGVADGLYRLVHPDTTTDSYFMQLPDEHEPVKDIEQAIENTRAENNGGTAELIGSYSGELPGDAEFNKEAAGTSEHPAVDPDEYAYLLTLKPELKELYYDGERLIVNAYFECPFAGDFLVGFGNKEIAHRHNLDMLTAHVLGTVNGTPYEFGGYAHGVIPVFDKREANGFTMQTDIDLNTPLPDGKVEMTLYYYIYNCDNPEIEYNIARVKHQFSFDTTAGNKHETKTCLLTLSGSAPMTVTERDPETKEFTKIGNRTVSFDGVTLNLETTILPGGMTIAINTYTAPDSFNEDLMNSLLTYHEGLQFDVYVNGERIEYRVPNSLGGDRWKIELPIHAEDLPEIRSIRLVPKIVRITGIVPILDPMDGSKKGDPIVLTVDAAPTEMSGYGYNLLGWEETVLSDCAFELPLS